MDVALECAGVPETLVWCMAMLRRGGRCAAVGIPLTGVELALRTIVLDELDLVGVRASAGEMRRVIPLIASGEIRAAELITHRFPLAEFSRAFETFVSREGGALKVILHP